MYQQLFQWTNSTQNRWTMRWKCRDRPCWNTKWVDRHRLDQSNETLCTCHHHSPMQINILTSHTNWWTKGEWKIEQNSKIGSTLDFSLSRTKISVPKTFTQFNSLSLFRTSLHVEQSFWSLYECEIQRVHYINGLLIIYPVSPGK